MSPSSDDPGDPLSSQPDHTVDDVRHGADRLSTGQPAVARPPVRVQVHTANDLVRRGLHAIVAQHRDRAQVVDAQLPAHDGDVLLLDTHSIPPGGPGARAQVRALASGGHGSVVVLGWGAVPDEGHRVLEAAGARGYVSMRLEGADLVAAVVRFGRAPATSPDRHLRSAPVSAATVGLDAFSGREAQIVGLICRGLTNQQIAAELFIGMNSLKTYIRCAYRKIGVESRTQAVIWGLEHGL